MNSLLGDFENVSGDIWLDLQTGLKECPAGLNKSETRQGARRGARRGLGCARSALRHLRRGECASVRQPSVCSEGRASLVKAPFDFDVQAGLNR